jgi:hypothetical protein
MIYVLNISSDMQGIPGVLCYSIGDMNILRKWNQILSSQKFFIFTYTVTVYQIGEVAWQSLMNLSIGMSQPLESAISDAHFRYVSLIISHRDLYSLSKSGNVLHTAWQFWCIRQNLSFDFMNGIHDVRVVWVVTR